MPRRAKAVQPVAPDARARAELLDQTSWANEFDWSELENLAGYLRARRARAGEVICDEGDEDTTLFIIASGAVLVLKEDPSGSPALRRDLARLTAGQPLGEMALLEGAPRSATAVALEDLELLTLTRGELDLLVAEKPRLAIRLLFRLASALAQRLRKTTSALGGG